MASDLGRDANMISRFFSRSGWLLNVDNFALTLVKDSGKWAATNSSVLSDTSAAWLALKSLGSNGLKSSIDQQLEALRGHIKQFQALASRNL